MRADVLTKRSAPLVIDDVTVAPPGAGEAPVRLAESGVCHSDPHHWRREMGSVLPLELPLDSAVLIARGVVTGVGAVLNTVQVPAGADVLAIGATGTINASRDEVVVRAQALSGGRGGDDAFAATEAGEVARGGAGF